MSIILNPGARDFIRRASGAAGGTPQNLEAELQERGQADFGISQQRTQSATRQIQGAVDQVGLSDAVSKAGNRADASFDVAEGVLGRRQEALGLTKNRRQKTVQGRRLSLGREIARDDAEGDVRRGFSARATEAARAGVGLQDELNDVQTDALAGLANAEGQEKIRAAQERANKKAAKNSMISSGIGMGLSLLALSDENAKHSKRSLRLDRVVCG